MAEGLVLVCMVGGMFAALVGILAYAARKNREREAIWRSFAESRGGAFRPAHGFLGSQAASIELVVSGAAVLIDSYVVSTGKSSTTYTRARASSRDLLDSGRSPDPRREHRVASQPLVL